MLKNTPTKVLIFLTIILVFFTPLVFVTNTQEAFEFPKMFFVYALGTSIGAIKLLQLIWTGKKLITPKLPILLILLSYTVSTLFSTHLYTSIWGYYSRFNGGLASLLVFLVIYTTLLNIKDIEKNRLEKILDVSIILGAVPISLYAIIQQINAAEVIRVYSTLGQPNWLGAYLGMIFPIPLYKAFKYPDNEKVRKGIALLTAVLIFSGIWFTYSVSSVLGLLGGLGYLIYRNYRTIWAQKNMALLFLTVLVSISILNPGLYKQKVTDIFWDLKKQETVTQVTVPAQTDKQEINREQPTENLEVSINHEQLSDPGFIRIYLWKGTLKLATRNFKTILIGTGPQTFPYEFQEYRPKELNYSSEWDFILNKPHNFYLELLAEIGVFGMASYIYLLIQIMKNTETPVQAAIVVLALTNFFSWPTVSTTLLFWVFAFYQKEKKTSVNIL